MQSNWTTENLLKSRARDDLHRIQDAFDLVVVAGSLRVAVLIDMRRDGLTTDQHPTQEQADGLLSFSSVERRHS